MASDTTTKPDLVLTTAAALRAQGLAEHAAITAAKALAARKNVHQSTYDGEQVWIGDDGAVLPLGEGLRAWYDSEASRPYRVPAAASAGQPAQTGGAATLGGENAQTIGAQLLNAYRQGLL
jgi:hypothetical protein